MTDNASKLDNPAWFSLSEVHSRLAIECAGVKFYQPEYCPFGGFMDAETVAGCLDMYASLTGDFYIIGERPSISRKLFLRRELDCYQMVLDRPVEEPDEGDIVRISTADEPALIELVNLVQPGYFREKTPFMGTYYGIFRDGMPVAVAGERMKMDAYTEVSAVVTRPGHTGKGYASRLVTLACARIFAENKIPYLHVAASNSGAIRLYEQLGFRKRREISFWNLDLAVEQNF